MSIKIYLNRNFQIAFILTLIVILVFFGFITKGTTLITGFSVGQVSVSAQIGNVPPEIISGPIVYASTYYPPGDTGTTLIELNFTVRDNNTIEDIETVYCNITHSGDGGSYVNIQAANLSCQTTDQTCTYYCNQSFPYNENTGQWNVIVYVSDGVNSTTGTTSFIYANVLSVSNITRNPAGDIDPTPCGATTITGNITIQDNNSMGDINTVYCNISGPGTTKEPTVTNSSCTSSNITCTYTCSYDFQYYEENGTWTITFYVKDGNLINNGSGVTQNEVTKTNDFIYTVLVSFNVSTSQISFQASPGDTDVAANTPINGTNCGNTPLIGEINGTDLTFGSYSIGVENLTFNQTNNPAYGEPLNYSQKIWNASIPYGSNVETHLYTWLNVPSTLYPGTYTGTIWVEGS